MRMGVFAVPEGETRPPIMRALAAIGAERKNMDAVTKLIRIRRRIEAAARDFEAARIELVKRHGVQFGEQWKVQPGAPMAAFQADFIELCQVDLPDDVLAETISLDELWARGPAGERIPIDVAENDIDALRAAGIMTEPEAVAAVEAEEPEPPRQTAGKRVTRAR